MDPDGDSSGSGSGGDRPASQHPSSVGKVGFTLDIVHDAGDWTSFGSLTPTIEAAAEALAALPGLTAVTGEACIVLSSDAEVRKLNAQWRGLDKPTNVLSFPAPAPPSGLPVTSPPLLGDIVLAAETLAREAGEQAIPPCHHLQHLVIHGLLHLLGYDHETAPEAEVMEALEVAALARLAIPSPYEGSEPIAAQPGAETH